MKVHLQKKFQALALEKNQGVKAPWADLKIFLPGAIRRALNVPWPKK